MEILAAKKLSDTDLTAALYKAIASERSHVADSIACLIEISARDLHTRPAHATGGLVTFCLFDA